MLFDPHPSTTRDAWLAGFPSRQSLAPSYDFRFCGEWPDAGSPLRRTMVFTRRAAEIAAQVDVTATAAQFVRPPIGTAFIVLLQDETKALIAALYGAGFRQAVK